MQTSSDAKEMAACKCCDAEEGWWKMGEKGAIR
jgi:hypothetical protein